MTATDLRTRHWAGIRFGPWIGKHYEESALGFRLLIAGESHYQKNSRDWAVDQLGQNFTQEFIEECSEWHPLCTRVASLFQSDAKDHHRFWNDVCFYNYVQFPLPTSKHRPTAEMWGTSAEPFETVLMGLMPDAVFMLGQGVWNNSPYLKGDWSKPIQDGIGQQRRVWDYHLEPDHLATACSVHHPSRGWNAERWTPVARELRRRTLERLSASSR